MTFIHGGNSPYIRDKPAKEGTADQDSESTAHESLGSQSKLVRSASPSASGIRSSISLQDLIGSLVDVDL